jgi:hypothetical protein
MSSNALRSAWLGAAVLTLSAFALAQPRAEEKDPAVLAAAMKGARSTLEQGLTAAGQKGRPISAKFEVEEGKLQLSVYVQSTGEFDEVLLNPQSGTVMSAKQITDAEDLEAAKQQSAAMAKARTTLLTATQHAVAGHSGTRAVSAFPELHNGQVLATVTLVQGNIFSKTTEKLD